jgi:hypothetical protein
MPSDPIERSLVAKAARDCLQSIRVIGGAACTRYVHSGPDVISVRVAVLSPEKVKELAAHIAMQPD